MSERTQRRLAAIVSADVVGYSRLMGADEEATLARLRADRKELIDPLIEAHSGRIVKTMGDGLLLEFPSVVNAVKCSVALQSKIFERNAGVPETERIELRIGVNLGDIVIEGDDIYGDGVNVAARLQEASNPGGMAISGVTHESLGSLVETRFERQGTRKFKNIARPIDVWTWSPGGMSGGPASGKEIPDSDSFLESIRYCTSRDGTPLAYAMIGNGPPLFKAQHFNTHLEFAWDSPTLGPFYKHLATDFQLVLQDQRGNGLSDRNPTEISFERFVDDFSAVADAAGIDRFPVYGVSQGSAVAVAYAVRNPERVSALILHGGYVRGRLKRGAVYDDEIAKVEALKTLIRTGWGQDDPTFRHMFTTMYIPGATTHQMDSFDRMMHVATDPSVAAKIFHENALIDNSDIIGQVKAPTLVLHSTNDLVSPFEEGRRLAAGIPNAKLVRLSSANHILLDNEPEMMRVVAEIRSFLGAHPT